MTHRTADELRAALGHIRCSPADGGRLELIVRRPVVGVRECIDEATLDLVHGLVGDSWKARSDNSATGASPDTDRQLTLMNARVAALVAVDPDRRALAGDQLYVDLDLGIDNLPPGTRLALGTAVIEVTAAPHRGCAKFNERFGVDALRFVNSPEGVALNLRGINTKIVVPGTVHLGEVVRKVALDA
jgi:hypothetical protein